MDCEALGASAVGARRQSLLSGSSALVIHLLLALHLPSCSSGRAPSCCSLARAPTAAVLANFRLGQSRSTQQPGILILWHPQREQPERADSAPHRTTVGRVTVKSTGHCQCSGHKTALPRPGHCTRCNLEGGHGQPDSDLGSIMIVMALAAAQAACQQCPPFRVHWQLELEGVTAAACSTRRGL